MQFVCRLGTPDGRVLEEQIHAPDERSLRGDLERRGYHVFEVRRRGLPRGLALPSFSRRDRISQDEFLIFNRELAALLRAGLPLLQALDLMLERMENPAFRRVLTDVRDRVESGEDLSEAFASYGDRFPRLYAPTLKAGERSGELESVIRRFIRYLKLVGDARKKVVSALVYPAVLVVLSIAMIAVMTIYVVPRFSAFFDELDAELPLLTRVTLAVASFLSASPLVLWNWAWIALGVAIGALALRRWGETPAGAVYLDHLKLRVPLLGPVLQRFGLSQFCRSLATLLAGGIPLVSSFEIAVGAVGNAFLRERLGPTIKLVREGKEFHHALEESGVFTAIAIDMVKVGEATGALDEMLGSLADFFDEQVEMRMQRLLALVEPMMLVFMGLIIAILLVSIYLPLFSVLGDVRG